MSAYGGSEVRLTGAPLPLGGRAVTAAEIRSPARKHGFVLCAGIEVGIDQPFEPVKAMPAMSWRCMTTKRAITGSEATTDPANRMGKLVRN